MRLRKIYCEHGSLTKDIKKLAQSGTVEVVHFPYDPGSHTRKIPGIATPSNAQIQDLNLPIADLPGTIEDYSGSVHFAEILLILGDQNWRDALHVDSAFRQGCLAFVTPDKGHILKHKIELERLLGIRFFYPNEWRDLKEFVVRDCGAN
ncbi:MAG: hypothetical protein WBF04_21385 [Candidatus Sulfotelmatobacter sp.]